MVALHEKIRTLREFNDWTQEKMAELMGLSTNGYARLERGESKLKMEHIEKIAQLFKINITDLINSTDKGVIFLLTEKADNTFIAHNDIVQRDNTSYYGSEHVLLENEIQKLKLIIQHKDEIIQQKDKLLAQQENENKILKLLVDTLQK